MLVGPLALRSSRFRLLQFSKRNHRSITSAYILVPVKKSAVEKCDERVQCEQTVRTCGMTFQRRRAQHDSGASESTEIARRHVCFCLYGRRTRSAWIRRIYSPSRACARVQTWSAERQATSVPNGCRPKVHRHDRESVAKGMDSVRSKASRREDTSGRARSKRTPRSKMSPHPVRGVIRVSSRSRLAAAGVDDNIRFGPLRMRPVPALVRTAREAGPRASAGAGGGATERAGREHGGGGGGGRRGG